MVKKIMAINIDFIKSFEILRINLSFDYDIFVANKILYSLFEIKKVFFIVLILLLL